ncbi:MAG: hypothetical protein PHZ00_06960 [Candidatus Peribacteraceae bacterium]|nr:hypothetical protein [Candidatus Peribacteraceae bacterium]
MKNQYQLPHISMVPPKAPAGGPAASPDSSPKNEIMTEINAKLTELRNQVEEQDKEVINTAITALEASLKAPEVNETTLNSVKLSLERAIAAYVPNREEAVLKRALEGMQKLTAEGNTGIQDPKVQEFLKKIPGGDRLGPMLKQVEGYIQAYPSFLNAGKFKEWGNSDSPLWKLIMSYLKTLPQSEINFLQTELAQYGKKLADGTELADVRTALNRQVPEGKSIEKQKKPKGELTYDFVDHFQRTMIEINKSPEKKELEISDFTTAGTEALKVYKAEAVAPTTSQVAPAIAATATAEQQKLPIGTGESKNLTDPANNKLTNVKLELNNNERVIALSENDGTKVKRIKATGKTIESLAAVPAQIAGTFGKIEVKFLNNEIIQIDVQELNKVLTEDKKNLPYGTAGQMLAIEILPEPTA